MKHQALLSSKDISKKISVVCCKFLFGANIRQKCISMLKHSRTLGGECHPRLIPLVFVNVGHHYEKLVNQVIYCKAPQCWPPSQNFGECSIFNPTFTGFEELIRLSLFSFSLLFIGHYQSVNLV